MAIAKPKLFPRLSDKAGHLPVAVGLAGNGRQLATNRWHSTTNRRQLPTNRQRLAGGWLVADGCAFEQRNTFPVT